MEIWTIFGVGECFSQSFCWINVQYRVSSNKRPGAYFLHGLQAPAVKRDRAFIRGPVLISYHLFWRYDGPTTFANCGAPTWSLSASSRRPPTTAAMAFCAPRTLISNRFRPTDATKDNQSTNAMHLLVDKLIAGRTADRSTQVIQLSSSCMAWVRQAHFGPRRLFETRRLFPIE